MKNENQSGHTSGPWHTGEGQANRIVYAPNSYAICDAKVFHRHIDMEEAEANAHLIAASPDLLCAIENLVAFIQANKEVPADILADAQAAIAKAKGAA